tara:strand:+ start:2720 stop:3262 length:543 start_codon:yes stop_codon:yes gene_type:complete
MSYVSTQNQLLLNKLLEYYKKDNNIEKILPIINGEHTVSLRVIDWFVTNYSKKNFTQYEIDKNKRFKVYVDYKLKLKAYSKKRFDPFCRWDRITIPYNDKESIQTTLGQLNFFKWILENDILKHIETNLETIEKDMNKRSSSSKNRKNQNNNTRKKRTELSVCATKSIKKENVEITISFN